MREIISNLRTEILESDDGKQRYVLRKCWDESKPSLGVLMLCPSSSGEVAVDTSTSLVLSNCYRLGYGSVTIVNLFSTINDFDLKEADDEDPENLQAILDAAKSASCFVVGCGTGKSKNAKFHQRLEQVLLALRPYEDKLCCLCDKNGGSKYLHPLSPRVREWHLMPLKVSELIDIPVEETEAKKKGKSKPSSKKNGAVDDGSLPRFIGAGSNT